MIIDVHTHIAPSRKAQPKVWWEEIYRTWEGRIGKKAAEERLAKFDPRVESLIRDMDEIGIDKAVALPLDLAVMCEQEAELSIWEINEYVAEAQSRFRDRIIGFVGVDPLRKEAIEVLEKGVKDWGLKGVKLFPACCKVTDERVQPFFAKINELELPVVFHQGTDPLPYLIEYGNPADLEVLTLKYRKIRMVAAHLGRGYEHLLAALMKYHPEVMYADISGLQYAYYDSPWYFIMQMRYQMDRNPWAILMGSDWPFNNSPPPPVYREWFDIIRDLKVPDQLLQSGLGMKQFTQEEKDRILGENARHWLRLSTM